MHKLTPTPAEIAALRARIPPGPVVIVNLLKFKAGPDGRAAYARYLEAARPTSDPEFELIYVGEGVADVGEGEDWDYVIIARYPSFDRFARVVTHPNYQNDAAAHRPAALERTVMLVSQPADLAAFFAQAN